jgi:hypothetical protein
VHCAEGRRAPAAVYRRKVADGPCRGSRREHWPRAGLLFCPIISELTDPHFGRSIFHACTPLMPATLHRDHAGSLLACCIALTFNHSICPLFFIYSALHLQILSLCCCSGSGCHTQLLLLRAGARHAGWHDYEGSDESAAHQPSCEQPAGKPQSAGPTDIPPAKAGLPGCGHLYEHGHGRTDPQLHRNQCICLPGWNMHATQAYSAG